MQWAAACATQNNQNPHPRIAGNVSIISAFYEAGRECVKHLIYYNGLLARGVPFIYRERVG